MLNTLAIAILAAAVGIASGALLGNHYGRNSVQTAWEQERALQAVATQHAEHEQRKIEQARNAEAERISNEAQTQVAAAQNDVATARAAADRLRQRVDALVAASRTRPTPELAIPGASEQGSDALDLLAQLHSGIDDAAGQIAEYADRLKVAGLACEAGADSLLIIDAQARQKATP